MKREALYQDRSCSLGNVQKHVTLYCVTCRGYRSTSCSFPNVFINTLESQDCKSDFFRKKIGEFQIR